jgi:hypothetical protein
MFKNSHSSTAYNREKQTTTYRSPAMEWLNYYTFTAGTTTEALK